MIIVRVELWSAVSGEVTELARMGIDNIAVSPNGRLADYNVRTWRGRSAEQLTRAMMADDGPAITRRGRVDKHRRLDLHVWNLVGKALAAMGYGND